MFNSSIRDEHVIIFVAFVVPKQGGTVCEICEITGWWFGTSILFSQKYWVANHPN